MLVKNLKSRNLLDDLFGDSFFSEINDVYNKPNGNRGLPYDIIEAEDDFKIELMLAGFNKKDFNLEVDEGKLIISGERKEIEDTKYNHRQSYFGKITKTFTLPKDVIVDKIDAEYVNGVLVVTIPKDKELINSKSIVVR